MDYWNCWADFLGADRSFLFSTAIRRCDRGVLSWRGSVTLNRVLMDNKLQRNKWAEHGLLKAAQVMGAGTGPTKTLSWTKAVKKARTSEAGR